MKITKSKFLDISQSARGNMGGQANLLSSRGIPPVLPYKGNSGLCMHVDVCVCVCVCVYVCWKDWCRGWGRGKQMSQGWFRSTCHIFWSILSKRGRYVWRLKLAYDNIWRRNTKFGIFLYSKGSMSPLVQPLEMGCHTPYQQHFFSLSLLLPHCIQGLF